MSFNKFLVIILGCYAIYYLIAFLTEMLKMKPQIAGDTDTEGRTIHYEVENPKTEVKQVVSEVTAMNHREMNKRTEIFDDYHSGHEAVFDLEMEQISEGIEIDQDTFKKLKMI